MTTPIVHFLAFSVLVEGNSKRRAQAAAHQLVADLEVQGLSFGDIYMDKVDDTGPYQTYRVGVKFTGTYPLTHVRAFLENRLAKDITFKEATNA